MSLGSLGLIFLVKYSPGISHNLCTKVRRERDEICLMTGSWDALSTGMMELSPGKRWLRGLARTGSGGVQTARSPSAAGMLCLVLMERRELQGCRVLWILV